ncbi:SDR family oxidoreductase [Tenacibaculum maritimum]|uniref:SDR family oxidoreductase n=1 Tax=Tenacibaculum maritimum TaxID=107401 RepID=UPI003876D3E9
MKILVTGTTGYIAKRLIPVLLEKKHTLVCCVRDKHRIPEEFQDNNQIEFVVVDFLKKADVNIPSDIDIAYYLIHSMSTSSSNFDSLERICATNFNHLISQTSCKQVIYLSGIVNDDSLSKHLKSRHKVEEILSSSTYALTTLRAGIIVGSGSASFEIIRDLVEKLPIMVAPKWLHTKTQPIAIRDVLIYLTEAIGKDALYDGSFDIYGPEVLTYKQMLLQFAEVRGFKRWILTLPVLTPKLSSYWLYFVTSTSFNLARSLVDSMKVPVIGKESAIKNNIKITPLTYKMATQKAFSKIAQNSIVSSWKDAMISGVFKSEYTKYIDLPNYGCFKDLRSRVIKNEEKTLNKIWEIGGKRGWYKFNFLWRFRGFIDQLFGGVGLRRGRRHDSELKIGDAIDFWRVLLADKKQKRLLLFAEMKLPGEAWLEFKIIKNKLYQRAVFRPKGVLGRLYWYSVLPFHAFVFRGMIHELIKE